MVVTPVLAKALVWLAVMLAADYLAVIAAIAVDFRSGILRARREGKPRTSRGYRRTVDKTARYLTTLMALTLVDVILGAAALMLLSTMGWEIPVFPITTTAGAVALSLIEVKSVLENSHRRGEFTEAASAVSDLLTSEEITRLIDILRRLDKPRG